MMHAKTTNEIENYTLDPPASTPSESCLVASMILDAGCIPEVRGIVRSDDFVSADCRILFAVLCDLSDAGSKIDAVIVREELYRRKLMQEAGGFDRMLEILHSVPAPAHAVHYALAIADSAKLRGVMGMCLKYLRRCNTPHAGELGQSVLEDLLREASALQAASDSAEIQPIGDVITDVVSDMRAEKQVKLLPTGIAPLDAATGGLAYGEMTIIAARPSMGKSLLAKQILRSVAKSGIPVGLVSIEERAKKVARNHLSATAVIENHRVRRGRGLTADEWSRIDRVAREDAGLPMFINEKACRLSQVASTISVMVARYKCQLIAVDYLQLIDAEGGQSREQEVSRVSRRLKNIFKQLDVAGIVVAQLNRGNEKGDVRPPRMSDLRDSGQIEQDADLILLLHRPDYYARENEGAPTDNRCYIIPAKNRDGSREDDIVLIADLAHQRFLTEQEWQDPYADHPV